MIRALALAWVIAAGSVAGPLPAPVVVPMMSDGVGAGFVLEMENTSGEDVHVLKLMGTCRYKIDGVEERYGGGGSSGAVSVTPGARWKEIVKFLSTQRAPGARRPAEALWTSVAGYHEVVVRLTAGRHVASFQCGGPWSADVPFYWDTPSQRSPADVISGAGPRRKKSRSSFQTDAPAWPDQRLPPTGLHSQGCADRQASPGTSAPNCTNRLLQRCVLLARANEPAAEPAAATPAMGPTTRRFQRNARSPAEATARTKAADSRTPTAAPHAAARGREI